eukprot:3605577-Rhodomonas_salina.3
MTRRIACSLEEKVNWMITVAASLSYGWTLVHDARLRLAPPHTQHSMELIFQVASVTCWHAPTYLDVCWRLALAGSEFVDCNSTITAVMMY